MRGIIKANILLVILILFIQVSHGQNNPPVAVFDSVVIILPQYGGTDSVYYVNLLVNDYDPDGDAIEIAEIIKQGGGEVMVFNDSIMIKDYGLIEIDITEQVYKYRVREVNDTAVLSNWAYVNFNPALDHTYPIARNDTVHAIPGHPVSINVLRNDIHPLGDSMFLHNGDTDSTMTKLIDLYDYSSLNNGYKTYFYLVYDSTLSAYHLDNGKIIVQLSNYEFFDSLTINNVNARFNNFGIHFQSFDQEYHPQFRVPQASSANSIFLSTVWIGGLDNNGNLHMAGERYRSGGADFWHGPVSEVYDSVYDLRWYYTWNLTREAIEYHQEHWNEPGYEPINDIATWPGNGDVEKGQDTIIAPFDDHNGDGIYNPLDGDAPRIRGDQSLFFVFNDDRMFHSETDGIALGVEFRGMAYAFDEPEDSTLNNTVFLHYDIVNRSDTSYQDVFLASFTHFQLGYDWDNYIESDVQQGMYFCYNGKEFDPDGYESPGYGDHPPAQAVVLLAGPAMEPDGIDNPKYDLLGNQVCDESLNGMNFGDGIIDNERLGMSFFTSFFYGDDPYTAPYYYMRMKGIWNDGTHLQYGGYGHPIGYALGPECRYQMPGDSDPCNWGTYGLWPNGGYNQNDLFWNERQLETYPSERRGLGSIGPFNLPAGESVGVDLAFPWARDYTGTAWSSAELLKQRVAYLRDIFQHQQEYFSSTDEFIVEKPAMRVYPNPANELIQLTINKPVQNATYKLVDIMGNVLKRGSLEGNTNLFSFDVSSLTNGMFFLKVYYEKKIISGKIVISR